MASKITRYLKMWDWVGTDGISRQEISNNFNLLDSEMFERGVSVQRYGAKGDGWNDDTKAIQAAIDSYSGIIIIPAGYYRITSPLQVRSNSMIFIHPTAVIKRGSNMNSMLINMSSGAGGYDGNKNITIFGGTWDANRAEFPTECSIIAMAHVQNVKIINSTFKNLHNWHMIELNAAKSCKIQNCTFDNYGSDIVGSEMVQLDFMLEPTVFPWHGPYDGVGCEDITIEGCTFTNGVTAIGSHSADYVVRHRKIRIINNYFEGMKKEAITALNYEDLQISGNFFNDCWKGIIVKSAYDLPLKGFDISHNRMTNITRGFETARAIQIVGTQKGFLYNGMIANNTIDTVSIHGIGLDYCDNWTVKGNEIHGCGQAGLWFYGSRKSSCVGNIVTKNNTMGINTRFDLLIGYLSDAYRAEDITVTGNVFGTVGIAFATRILVTSNIITSRLDVQGSIDNILRRENVIGGLMQENNYTATLLAGTTSVIVNHGLHMTPNNVQITPLDKLNGAWISDLTATTFKINVSTAPSSNVNIFWTATT